MSDLGKYRLEQRLGGGGMAEVFVGSMVGAEGFSRRVAIKRVLPGFSENPSFASMFVSEARISSRLVHPNIVSVLDFDRDPEHRLYLVMELVEGKDLDALSASGMLPVPVLVYVIAEVLRGLGYAHDLPVTNPGDIGRPDTMSSMRGVVHRDVSPHNVLLSWEGAVKVSDFGIAKARAASSATASEFIKGKPAYMSPEQANGEALDGRSDLFAVGVMFWEMLTGRRLFVGEDTRSTLAAVLFGVIPRPRSIRGDVPKDVERVVMKLLERDLPARYATAEEAITDLLECDDAPKDGRAMLAKVLAERFAAQAPVRGSVLRARISSAVAGAGTGPVAAAAAGGVTPLPPDKSTIADGAAGRGQAARNAAAAVSIGEARGAATGTMPHGAAGMARPAAVIGGGPAGMGTGKGKMIGLLVAGFAVTGAAAFGVVSLVTGKQKATGDGQQAAGSGQLAGMGTGTAAATGSATAAATGSATVTGSATATGSGSASGSGSGSGSASASGSASDGKKDAPAIAVAHPGAVAEKRFGKLHVEAYPVLTVYVDKKPYGDTPRTITLPVGKHAVRLVNSEAKHDETVSVNIVENDTVSIDRE